MVDRCTLAAHRFAFLFNQPATCLRALMRPKLNFGQEPPYRQREIIGITRIVCGHLTTRPLRPILELINAMLGEGEHVCEVRAKAK
jgi:hypothetical protein